MNGGVQIRGRACTEKRQMLRFEGNYVIEHFSARGSASHLEQPASLLAHFPEKDHLEVST